MIGGYSQVLDVKELEPQTLPRVHRGGRWSAGGGRLDGGDEGYRERDGCREREREREGSIFRYTVLISVFGLGEY